MPLSADDVRTAAQDLDAARLDARAVPRLTERHGDLANAEAYAIQEAGMTLRFARGEVRRGYKMGLTSEAKRQQMGLHAPVYGELTDAMEVRGGTYRLAGQIHPKIEPEIAFRVRGALGANPSREEVLAACDGVAAAMEILDSRYVGFKYFSLPDVIADNSSSSHYVLGPWHAPQGEWDLADLEMVMSVNGAPAESARSHAISGDPVRSVMQLCALLADRGLALPPGSIVLAGAATTAVPLEAGQTIALAVTHLGNVAVRIEA
jgi:2-oxo-3-hexenedioate decarboxylase